MMNTGPIVTLSAARAAFIARWARWGAALAVCTVGLVSCKDKQPPPTVVPVKAKKPPTAPSSMQPVLGDVDVEVTLAKGPAAKIADRHGITQALRALLTSRAKASGAFAMDASAPPDAPRAEIQVNLILDGSEVGARGLAMAHVGVRIATKPSSAPNALAEDLEATAEQPYETHNERMRGAVFGALAERAVGDLLDGFLARARLPTVPIGELETLLGAHAPGAPAPDPSKPPRAIDHPLAGPGPLTAPDRALLEAALRETGRRRAQPLAPLVRRYLLHDEETLRDAALGAAIRLRDETAVAILTRSRSLDDARELRKVIDAIGSIGGAEAAAYLDFVADGHDDEELREMARAARRRMARHPGKGDQGARSEKPATAARR